MSDINDWPDLPAGVEVVWSDLLPSPDDYSPTCGSAVFIKIGEYGIDVEPFTLTNADAKVIKHYAVRLHKHKYDNWVMDVHCLTNADLVSVVQFLADLAIKQQG